MPGINALGRNTAHSTSVMAMIGPVISCMAVIVASRTRQALGQPALDVLQHHDRVVDDDADRQHQPEQRQIVQREAQQQHDRERADQRHGHVDQRQDHASQSCRNSSTTIATRITASRSVLKTSATDSRTNGVVS